jgi:4-alpha-glucanotransferase
MSRRTTRPPGSPDAALRRLASLHGLQTSYLDDRQVRHEASREALCAVLRRLGAPIASPRDASSALAEAARAARGRMIEPVLAAWDGRLPSFRLRLPGSSPAGAVAWSFEAEHPSRAAPLAAGRARIAALPATASERIDGVRHVEREIALQEPLPHGYHRLRVEAGGRSEEALVISAPSAASPASHLRERAWGIFAPAYALHRRRSFGIGDLGDLAALAAWAGRMGAGVLGTLPLHPTYLEQEGEVSPYAPISRFLLNEIYIDLEAAPEFANIRRAVRGQDGAGAPRGRRRPGLVDYRRVLRTKRRALEAMSRALAESGTARFASFRRFLAANPIVADYARFRAAGERHGLDWRRWPEPMRAGRLEAADADPDAERYHAYAQWLAHGQLRATVESSTAAGVRLYFDLPLGVHSLGYDVYRNRDLFVAGLSAGAPPDSFFARGQDWGFQPLHPARLRERGHLLFIDTLRHQLRYARLLRIDHVMGLTRLFVIPEGGTPRDGVYLRYPEEELHAVLCLEARRAGAGIVGEDLGTVPPEVRERMDRHAVRRMYVAPFAIGDGPDPLPDPPAGSLAALNTHDMPPFASFWGGLDIGDRRRLGLLDRRGAARERRARSAAKRAIAGQLRRLGFLRGRADARRARDACVRFLAASRASIVLVNLEDLWLERKPQNTPGTTAERPNWRRRTRLSMEAIRSAGWEGLDLLRALRRLRPPPGGRRSRRRSGAPQRSPRNRRTR